jgi:hypothetical protein
MVKHLSDIDPVIIIILAALAIIILFALGVIP